MNHKITTLCLMVGLSLTAMAQTSRTELRAHLDLASGNYANYPNPSGHVTPAPDGYEPFYVSHYGRHGARYMTGDEHYKYTIAKMDTAKTLGLLTPYGEEILQKLNIAAADAYHRDGDLTKLGGRQHRAIAHRLCVNYPSLMNQAITVRANSSTVRRCMLSMANFCQELKDRSTHIHTRSESLEWRQCTEGIATDITEYAGILKLINNLTQSSIYIPMTATLTKLWRTCS